MQLDPATVAQAGGWPGSTDGDAPAPLAFLLTDLGNAERLVAQHGHDLRFVPGRGWHVWDGRRWRRDDDGELNRRIKLTVRAMQAEASAVDDATSRKRLLAHALRSEAHPRLTAAVARAESDAAIIARGDQLDVDPMLLNVQNGTVDLTVGELVAHDRDRLLTKLAPVEFSHEAQAPLWQAFLDRVFAGDRNLIDFVQRVVGYGLTGSIEEQVLFLLYGRGANGKTTFVETLRALLGDYAQQTPADTFLERREGGIPNDLARLPGARFVAAVETGEGRRLAETLLKRLTGGDMISARFLRQEYFEFTPTFKAWIATNHRPEIRGTDDAIWRRICLIPFEVTIPENERDLQLAPKLRAELPGILRWAVEGCLAWRDHGLTRATAVSTATAVYRADMDLLGSFLDERCIVAAGASVKSSVLYNAYGYWCASTGERDLTQKAFSLRLDERGFTRRKKKDGAWYDGLGLLHTEGER